MPGYITQIKILRMFLKESLKLNIPVKEVSVGKLYTFTTAVVLQYICPSVHK